MPRAINVFISAAAGLRRHLPFVVAIVLTLFVTVVISCSQKERANKTTPDLQKGWAAYAGTESCAGCHKSIYDQHLQTAHHNTSAAINNDNILGSFHADSNRFSFDEKNEVRMENRGGLLYQAWYNEGILKGNGRMDVIIGSGRKGQSFLNWKDGGLVQLPITFFSPAGQWSNSPGYPPHQVAFNRPITTRCLECHSTFVGSVLSTGQHRLEQLDSSKIIYGIGCEKCHGPSAAHVAFHQQNPQSAEGRFVVNPVQLSRERQLEVCGLCHGGQLKKTKPSFSFTAGDTLSRFFSTSAAMLNAANIDVHGNQLGLLSLSKCYTLSNMTCNSCHSPHANENQSLALYSARCATCHNNSSANTCPLVKTKSAAITQNCIDCHMPKQSSHAVAVYLQGAASPTPALMRTHLIKVYRGAEKNWHPLPTKKVAAQKPVHFTN